MDFNKISQHYLTSRRLWHPHLTAYAQCNVNGTSEFVYIRVTFNTLLLTGWSNSGVPT